MTKSIAGGSTPREEGGASVGVAAGVVVVLVVTLAALLLLSAIRASMACESAADLAALAAGEAWVSGGDPCQSAATTLAANGAELLGCQLFDDESVQITAGRSWHPAVPWGTLLAGHQIVVRSRAGPAWSSPPGSSTAP